MSNNTQDENLLAQLEWVQLRSELSAYENETQIEKLKRKTKETPLVPIG